MNLNIPDKARIRQLALLILQSDTNSLQVLDLLLKCLEEIKIENQQTHIKEL